MNAYEKRAAFAWALSGACLVIITVFCLAAAGAL